MNQAVVQQARRYLGLPFKGFCLDGGPKEQLQLDLSQVDCYLFLEKLLALNNSRRWTPEGGCGALQATRAAAALCGW